jgi:hypothetical protein
VIDSVHPVHSWNDNQITDCRLAFARDSAIAGAIDAGNAIDEATAVQNFRKVRRLNPRRLSSSPSVSTLLMLAPFGSTAGYPIQDDF